jgi:hypothetical protein
LGFGDLLLVDAAQGAPGAVVAVLVVDNPIGDAAGLLAGGGRPRESAARGSSVFWLW